MAVAKNVEFHVPSSHLVTVVSPPAVSIFHPPLALRVQGSQVDHTCNLEVLPQSRKVENTRMPISLALTFLYDRGSIAEKIRLEATTSAFT